MSKASDEFERLINDSVIFETELEINKILVNYYEQNPVGKVSDDGRYIMQENGMWHGRCALIPYLEN